MTNPYAPKPFWERLKETGRLAKLAVRLTWRASPRLMLSILLLLVLQALLSPLELALSRVVLDRATFDMGLTTAPDALALMLPLTAWIALAAIALAVGQLIGPFTSTFQSLVGNRLTDYVTEQLLRAANRWQGLERFEDPSFADDLQIAREHAAHGGLELVVDGAQAIVFLVTAASLAWCCSGCSRWFQSCSSWQPCRRWLGTGSIKTARATTSMCRPLRHAVWSTAVMCS